MLKLTTGICVAPSTFGDISPGTVLPSVWHLWY